MISTETMGPNAMRMERRQASGSGVSSGEQWVTKNKTTSSSPPCPVCCPVCCTHAKTHFADHLRMLQFAACPSRMHQERKLPARFQTKTISLTPPPLGLRNLHPARPAASKHLSNMTNKSRHAMSCHMQTKQHRHNHALLLLHLLAVASAVGRCGSTVDTCVLTTPELRLDGN